MSGRGEGVNRLKINKKINKYFQSFQTYCIQELNIIIKYGKLKISWVKSIKFYKILIPLLCMKEHHRGWRLKCSQLLLRSIIGTVRIQRMSWGEEGVSKMGDKNSWKNNPLTCQWFKWHREHREFPIGLYRDIEKAVPLISK